MSTHTEALTRRFLAPALAMALGLLAAGPAVASDVIEEQRALSRDGRLSIHNVAGEIRVTGWDREEMRLRVDPGRAFERVEITGDADSLRVRIRVDEDEDHVDDTDLELSIPHSVTLHVDAVSGDIEADRLSGEIDFQTVSGDVNLAGESRKVRIRTVSGDIESTAPSTDTDLTSVSGDIAAGNLGERLVAESVSGSIDVQVRPARRVDAQSVSGDVRLHLKLAPNADVSAQTLSGDVVLRLPGQDSFTATLKTFSGRLSVDGFEKPRRGETRHRFSANGGDGDVDLNSFSGDVEIVGE